MQKMTIVLSAPIGKLDKLAGKSEHECRMIVEVFAQLRGFTVENIQIKEEE